MLHQLVLLILTHQLFQQCGQAMLQETSFGEQDYLSGTPGALPRQPSSHWIPAVTTLCRSLPGSFQEVSCKSDLQPEIQRHHLPPQGGRECWLYSCMSCFFGVVITHGSYPRMKLLSLFSLLNFVKNRKTPECCKLLVSTLPPRSLVGSLWAVQVFSQPLLPSDCPHPVHPPAQDRLPLHLLGTPGESPRLPTLMPH